jgi:hypothetical protein
MCEAMKTTNFQIKMDNTNSKKPDKSTKILVHHRIAFIVVTSVPVGIIPLGRQQISAFEPSFIMG